MAEGPSAGMRSPEPVEREDTRDQVLCRGPIPIRHARRRDVRRREQTAIRRMAQARLRPNHGGPTDGAP